MFGEYLQPEAKVTSDILQNIGGTKYYQDKFDDALVYYKEALEENSREAKSDIVTANVYLAKGRGLVKQNKYVEAVKLFKE